MLILDPPMLGVEQTLSGIDAKRRGYAARRVWRNTWWAGRFRVDQAVRRCRRRGAMAVQFVHAHLAVTASAHGTP